MQLRLPIFPVKTKLINNNVGVFTEGDFVYYLHNGSPVFCHQTEDRNSYRYITGNLVVSGMCKPSEIAKVFGVSSRSIQRNAKSLREKGVNWFFNREDNRGKCYKLTEDLLEQIQILLDDNRPVSEIARQFEVTEGALRHHIRQGKLKKNPIKA